MHVDNEHNQHILKPKGPWIYSSVQFRIDAFQLINAFANLVGGQEAGQRVDQEASLEVLGVDPVVEAQPLVGLACVEALAVLPAQQEGVDADWP